MQKQTELLLCFCFSLTSGPTNIFVGWLFLTGDQKANTYPLRLFFYVSVYLMFQRAVLPLCLLPNDNQVQVVVASAVALQAIYMHHISKEVQFTPEE